MCTVTSAEEGAARGGDLQVAPLSRKTSILFPHGIALALDRKEIFDFSVPTSHRLDKLTRQHLQSLLCLIVCNPSVQNTHMCVFGG